MKKKTTDRYTIPEVEEEFIEKGADLEHERWASWQKYLHSLFPKNEDGSITISPERVERWERQIATPYADLPENEKEYDRIEVRKYLPFIRTQIQKAEERWRLGMTLSSFSSDKIKEIRLDERAALREKLLEYADGAIEDTQLNRVWFKAHIKEFFNLQD